MSDHELPLFPLEVVLFPESGIALHIFEKRYKVLINECLTEGKEFGINLVHGGGMSAVGCSARVKQVVKRYPDGKLDIIVEGSRRYKLLRLERRKTPYAVGSVEYLHDESEAIDDALAVKTLDLYRQLVEMVYEGTKKVPAPENVMTGLSFRMGEKAGLDLAQRQQLLELSSENERLKLLERYLMSIIPRLQRREEVDRISHNDGYL